MTETKRGSESATTARSRWVLGFVFLYVALQILIPLRHLLYKRDLEWTHEGSNFSWRMMADHHETSGGITIEDPQTHDVYNHSPAELLNNKQLVMVNNPYMLFQYVQFLKQYLKQHTEIRDPIIKADIQMSVNGKPAQYLYDPNSNLSEVTYSPFRELPWIMPLKEQ